ncbi:MAG: hypothetical protein J0626_04230 [Rhodospirillaceae bacterium]|nr:hypothetical protein [Rhodospirillaceae bacterium]
MLPRRFLQCDPTIQNSKRNLPDFLSLVEDLGFYSGIQALFSQGNGLEPLRFLPCKKCCGVTDTQAWQSTAPHPEPIHPQRFIVREAAGKLPRRKPRDQALSNRTPMPGNTGKRGDILRQVIYKARQLRQIVIHPPLFCLFD